MAFPAELAEHVRRVAPVMLAGDQMLSVPEVFHSLLPGGGIQRGWTTRVDGSASARALAWSLLGEATTAGRWVAAVNVPGISLAAASELGVAVERVLVVRNVSAEVWSSAIGALIGASMPSSLDHQYTECALAITARWHLGVVNGARC